MSARLSFVDWLNYSIEPYFNKKGDPCVLAYEAALGLYRKFTCENLRETNYKEDVLAWDKIFKNDLWRFPGDLNFPEEFPNLNDLKEIHRCLVSFINSRVWFRDKKVSIVLANWIILSYFRDKIDFIPLIIINGVTNSGKSTLGQILMSACYRGSTVGGVPASVIVQRINKFHTSMFLDGTLDALNEKDRTKIIESITSRLPYAQRSPSHGMNTYNIKTSVAISIKGQKIPEDIVNRGIRIQMFPKPNDVELESFYINENEFINDSYSLREIRAKLTALKISIELNNWNPIPRQIEKSYSMLTTKAENGELCYGVDYGLENAPKIVNSQLNIAAMILSIAMFTETERDTIEFILNSNVETKESDYNSFEGEVLRGFVDVLQDRIDNAPFKILSRSTLADMIRKITTRKIAQKVNDNMHANGDLDQRDVIKTCKITYTLKTLGITYVIRKGAGHNQSHIDPTTPGFFEQLEVLVRRYDSDNIDVLEKLKEKDAKG